MFFGFRLVWAIATEPAGRQRYPDRRIGGLADRRTHHRVKIGAEMRKGLKHPPLLFEIADAF